jgi:alkanesulfonate monooxygenase SsuD/methylene tetrahydromethanopterin reductase-like flavin-dependent oxidoreductase (luciferase family)
MTFTLDFSHRRWETDTDGRAARQTLETARAADAAGMDAIWISEDPEGWDAFAVLGALAVVTERAALGTSVTSPYPRQPKLLAASVATLDHLSRGRAVLGLGRGQVEWHRDALGVETGEPREVMRESIALLRTWWAAPHRATSPPGAHCHVRDWERVVHPLQEHVPIYLAAAGPKTLALAGAVGDGAIFNVLTSDEALRASIPIVRRAAAEAGRDPDALAIVLRTEIVVTDDPAVERKAIDKGKSTIALISTLPGMGRLVQAEGFDVETILREVRAIMGTREMLAEGLGFPAMRREGGLQAARAIIPDALIRRLGIIGPLPEARERLRALADIGVTHVGVELPPEPTSAEAWRRLLTDLREG